MWCRTYTVKDKRILAEVYKTLYDYEIRLRGFHDSDLKKHFCKRVSTHPSSNKAQRALKKLTKSEVIRLLSPLKTP